MADDRSRASARAMVDEAISLGLQPQRSTKSKTGFLSVIKTKNKWYQARFYDTARQRQRAVPGLHETPRDAALALAYAKKVLESSEEDGARLPSPRKKKPRCKMASPAAMPVAFALAMPVASPHLSFATVLPLAGGFQQQVDPFAALAELGGVYSSPVP